MAHGAKPIDPTFSAKSRPTWEVVRRVAVYLRPYKLLAATTILCAVLSLLSSFAFPKLTAYAIDEVIRKARPQLLTPVMLGLIGAFLLRDLFNALRILVNNHFEQNVIFDMRREAHEDTRFADRADALRQGTLGIMRVWAIYGPAMGFAGAIGFALVLWVGGRMVINHQMEPGALVGYLLYLGMFYTPVGQLHGLNQLLQSGRAAGERVFDILDATEERADRLPRPPLRKPVQGEVIYANVSFSYAAATMQEATHPQPLLGGEQAG